MIGTEKSSIGTRVVTGAGMGTGDREGEVTGI